jgi:hypothetical protein
MEKPLSRAKYEVFSLSVIRNSEFCIYWQWNMWFNAVVQ